MTFKFIDEELKSFDLKIVPLNALRPDDQSYSVLLNQYMGELKLTENFIGNSDETHKQSIEKFNDFFQIALKNEYDLAISPEYSCPWLSLKVTLESKLLPSPGKIWIIGAESISPKELNEFMGSQKDICWVYDKSLMEEKHKKNFLDPVCLFFKATNKEGKNVNVCAVQFKTQHMSVHNDIYREEDFLIEGNYLYVIRNEGNTINLLTMICSDSLKFSYQDVLNANLEKLLLVHVQMNLEPRHHIFKNYRNTILNGESINIEIVCLNWAKGSQVLKKVITYSGTCYFLKPEKPVLEDNRLNTNQDNGLFYSHWTAKRSHVFFYLSDEYLFGFSTSKTSQSLVEAPLRRREGPVSRESFQWNSVKGEYEIAASVADGFVKHCTGLKADLGPLTSISHINKERLIKLSNGINLSTKWHDVLTFDFFMMDDSEIINRIAFTDEPNVNTQTNRTIHLMNFKELVNIFNNNKAQFPASLVQMITASKIHYSMEVNPLINVYATADNQPIGTIAYLGSSLDALAKQTYDYLNEFYISRNQRQKGKPMIIIWYNDNGIKSYYRDNVSIDADLEDSRISINKE